jgi:hypothetical protein
MCYINFAIAGAAMSTTTIRLEDDLKTRINAAAAQAGKTAHAMSVLGGPGRQTVEQVRTGTTAFTTWPTSAGHRFERCGERWIAAIACQGLMSARASKGDAQKLTQPVTPEQGMTRQRRLVARGYRRLRPFL